MFTEINTGGTVFIKIVAQKGDACADFWWIKWPFGAVQQLGRHCNVFRSGHPDHLRGSDRGPVCALAGFAESSQN